MTIAVLTYCRDLISTSELFKEKPILFLRLEVSLVKVFFFTCSHICTWRFFCNASLMLFLFFILEPNQSRRS